MPASLKVSDFLNWPVFSLEKQSKHTLFYEQLAQLTAHHQTNCASYSILTNVLKNSFIDNGARKSILPLPVRIFKSQSLLSVDEGEVVKTMTSSGTTGQSVSKIYLDKHTAALQVKALSKIVTHFIGNQRLPMLVIDCPSTVKNKQKFSARTAGILGFAMYGRNITYALNDDMSLNLGVIDNFCEKHAHQKVLIFGFTYIVWLHFIQALKEINKTLKLDKGLLIHGGGWKKLTNEATSKENFKKEMTLTTGVKSIHNYYGMVEQTGSIFMECEAGHFHCSAWSNIQIRDTQTLEILPFGNNGLIELHSLLPYSYPGHIILSEDIGKIVGEDDCPCGRMGVYFDIEGRLKQAEVRGCSDTYTR